MGYYTYISGDGAIVPPLDDATLKPFTTDEDSYFRFEQNPGNQTVEVINGNVTVVGDDIGSTSLEFGYDESVKGYDFVEHVHRLVDLAKERGSVVTATFHGDGEESDDFWKVSVENNEVTQESGVVHFPSDIKALEAEAWDAAHRTLCTLHKVHKNCHANPYRK